MIEPPSSHIAIVVVAGRRAGLASRLESGFRFHASNHQFDAMDGQDFATIEQIQAAARGTLAALRLDFSLRTSCQRGGLHRGRQDS
ncbi:hypothetical protein [Ancylobacter sp. FA202]|uniref:hypothetical protein n=1 Tax=Ancylobacter sp. FA202 TaxID=1111106 RepID=UPI0012F8606E|nr:hypothetical protein [Ancylobacter sp. FA202]